MDFIKENQKYEAELAKKKQLELEKNPDKILEADEAEQAKNAQDEEQVTAQRDPKVKSMIKNLRIREDTAKYLYNLDDNANAGHYDGKSRSFRQHWKHQGGGDTYRADNWQSYTGDTKQLLEQEKFAWANVEQKGGTLNSVAFPTGTELYYKKMKEKNVSQQDR